MHGIPLSTEGFLEFMVNVCVSYHSGSQWAHKSPGDLNKMQTDSVGLGGASDPAFLTSSQKLPIHGPHFMQQNPRRFPMTSNLHDWLCHNIFPLFHFSLAFSKPHAI